MPIYLMYGEISGDVTESGHPSWIELAGVSFGSTRLPSRGFGGGGSSPSPRNEVQVQKAVDSASSQLQQAFVSGEPAFAVIDFVRESGGTSVRYEMSGTSITSYSASGNGPNPTESLTLGYAKVEFKREPGTPSP